MKYRYRKPTTSGRVALVSGVIVALYGFGYVFGAVLVISHLSPFSPVHIYPAIIVESVFFVPVCAFGAYRLIRYWFRSLKYDDDQCFTCGYSLVGNTSGSCPECGSFVGKIAEL